MPSAGATTCARPLSRRCGRRGRFSPGASPAARPTRYQMLDTIREYGAEELAARGGEADVGNRFITRYLSMARYFGEHVVDDDQLDRFRDLQGEHANLGA